MALVNIRLHHATPGNSAGPFASVTGLRAGCGSVTSAARVSSASPALPQTDPRTVTGPSAVELGSGPTAGDANPKFCSTRCNRAPGGRGVWEATLRGSLEAKGTGRLDSGE